MYSLKGIEDVQVIYITITYIALVYLLLYYGLLIKDDIHSLDWFCIICFVCLFVFQGSVVIVNSSEGNHVSADR